MYPQCPTQGAWHIINRCSVIVQRMSVPRACSALPHLLYQQIPIHPSRHSFRVFRWELVPPLCVVTEICTSLYSATYYTRLRPGFFPLTSELLSGRCWAWHLTCSWHFSKCSNLTYLFGSLLPMIFVVLFDLCRVVSSAIQVPSGRQA